MKKLISIGIALALLTMAVVPAAVAADLPDTPVTYSKTPFAILGGGIALVGQVLALAQPILTAAKIVLPFDLSTVTPITELVGKAVWVNLAWLTDMTAWSMVLGGDVVQKTGGIIEAVAPGALPAGFKLSDVSEIFYVVAARMWDPWSTYTGTILLPNIVVDAYPPTLDLLGP